VASAATVVLMGYIAEGTKTIRVGSGGIMLPNHAPLIVAEQFGTLGHLYPGRIDMGLGRAPGTDGPTAQAIRSDRHIAVQEFPQAIAEIQHYFGSDNKNSKVRAVVAEGVDVPIYILGSSTDSAYLAARLGLPYVFASHFAPTQLHHALTIYRRDFKPSAFLDKPYTIAGINTIVAPTPAAAETRATSMIQLMIGVLTGNRQPLLPPIEMTQELKELWHHPNVQQMLKYTFVGDKSRVKSDVLNFIKETGVDELMVSASIYHHEERVESFQLFSEVMQDLNI
jgi:luciferase family oxidoreductase group 1